MLMKSSRFEKRSVLWQHFESNKKHCVSFIVCMEGKICKSTGRGKVKL